MGRAVCIMPQDRVLASHYVAKAPPGTVIEFRRNKRSRPQNDRLHALISRVSAQLLWHGMRLDLDDWKLVFLDGLNREVRVVPSIDGRGFVNLGRKTSKLSVEECTALMDLVEVFAAQHGVDLGTEAP